MTNAEYNEMVTKILYRAKTIVGTIEGKGPDYSLKMTGWDENTIQELAHDAHKLAVKLVED